jgi:hypothetical protein
MAELLTYQNAYLQATAGNTTYSRNQLRWKFLLDSFTGGQAYREGAYLQRYALESDTQYAMRLNNTPLDNQVRSLISLYTSFLFRTAPERDFGVLDDNQSIADILEDADLDGRSLNAFMKDVAQWASVFGHVWIAVAKPNVGAVTLADEQAMGARPYLSMYLPLAVTDWRWARQPNGGYQLEYIKYVEEVNGTETVVKEWTADSITTYKLDTQQERVLDMNVEVNGLGYLPFVCAYAERSPVRGLGNSLVDDIADQQRMIYNELAEVYDSIRLDTHPSLVATAGTNAQGAAAGQVITMEENLDPNLKPYVLQFEGGQIDKIYTSINNRRQMIDSMGNVGAVRSTETREMSGIAIETEFQLLNARLSSIADNLELAEEQIWQIVYAYMGYEWDGVIDYPDNFALRNVESELDQLTKIKSLSTRPEVQTAIDNRVAEMLDIDEIYQAGEMLITETVEAEDVAEMPAAVTECPIATQDVAVNLANRETAIDTANYGPLNPNRPNEVFWMRLADKWDVSTEEAQLSRCGNCAAFNITDKIENCIESGLAAGGATGSEWDTVAAGELGYCEAFDFKCASNRTCDAWVVGGPISD